MSHIRNTIITLFAFVALLSCKTESIEDFEGDWIDRKSELQTLRIETEKGQYVMRGYWGDYKLSVKDGKYPFVFLNGKEFPVKLDRRSGILSFNGKLYIKQSEAIKPHFMGQWLDESGRTHRITTENSMPVWDVWEEGKDPVRYWPRFDEGKFTLTMDNEQIWFSLEGSEMVDSNGVTYSKID